MRFEIGKSYLISVDGFKNEFDSIFGYAKCILVTDYNKIMFEICTGSPYGVTLTMSITDIENEQSASCKIVNSIIKIYASDVVED